MPLHSTATRPANKKYRETVPASADWFEIDVSLSPGRRLVARREGTRVNERRRVSYVLAGTTAPAWQVAEASVRAERGDTGPRRMTRVLRLSRDSGASLAVDYTPLWRVFVLRGGTGYDLRLQHYRVFLV